MPFKWYYSTYRHFTAIQYARKMFSRWKENFTPVSPSFFFLLNRLPLMFKSFLLILVCLEFFRVNLHVAFLFILRIFEYFLQKVVLRLPFDFEVFRILIHWSFFDEKFFSSFMEYLSFCHKPILNAESWTDIDFSLISLLCFAMCYGNIFVLTCLSWAHNRWIRRQWKKVFSSICLRLYPHFGICAQNWHFNLISGS